MSDEPERWPFVLSANELEAIVLALTLLLAGAAQKSAVIEPGLYEVALQLHSRLGQALSNLRDIPEGDDDEKIGVG